MDSKTSCHGVYPVPVLSFILTSFKQKHNIFIYFFAVHFFKMGNVKHGIDGCTKHTDP